MAELSIDSASAIARAVFTFLDVNVADDAE
jgi:hypothetical protein